MATEMSDRGREPERKRAKSRSFILPASARREIEESGSRAERRKLKRQELKEQQLYGHMEAKSMKLTVKELNHPMFISALQKLDNCQKYPNAQVAWQVMKLVKACHENIKKYRDEYQTYTKSLAQLDEHGNVKVENGEIVFKDDQAKAEHEGSFERFMSQELEIKGKQLDLNHLAGASLSPHELEALVPIIDPESAE